MPSGLDTVKPLDKIRTERKRNNKELQKPGLVIPTPSGPRASRPAYLAPSCSCVSQILNKLIHLEYAFTVFFVE